MNESDADKAQTFATDVPDISALQQQFETCSPHTNGWNRIDDNDATRYTVWAGQSADGKKWDDRLKEGEQAFPFNGASDARVPLADEIINDLVDVITEAFWRSVARVQGNPETDKSGKAAYARKLIEWIKGTKLYGELVQEIELHAQNGLTYGASLLQVGWERQLGYRLHTVELSDLMQGAQMALKRGKRSILGVFVDTVMDPTQDSQNIAIAKQIYAAYVQQAKPSNYDWDVAELSDSRARKAIKELRKRGKCTLPLPYLCKNEPFLKARKLWEDVFIPDCAWKVQESPVVFVLDLYTEAELRGEAEALGWNPDWVEEAIKHKGEFSTFTASRHADANGTYPAEFSYNKVDYSELIEVTTAYRKLVDEDGILGVYETVFHGLVLHGPRSKEPLYASHGLQEAAIGLNYPFCQWRREINKRSLLASRGIPQIVATWQRSVKVQEDSITDRTSFETMPSILVPSKMGVNMRFGPAVQIPLQNMQNKPEFMETPASTPGTAFELMDRIEKRVDRYFGRRRMDSPPEDALIKRQKTVRTFLLSCTEALQFMFQLIATNMSPEEIEQITGMKEPFGDPGSIESETAFMLSFDVQELSPDFQIEKNKALTEISAEDAGGVIDKGKLTIYKLRSLDPNMIGEITTDQMGASQMILGQVKADFANMMLGVPATPVENDPTAPMQLQFAEQLIQVSPKYQMALKNDPNFQKLVQDWVKNRKFSIMQQENKQIGRVGVDQSSAE